MRYPYWNERLFFFVFKLYYFQVSLVFLLEVCLGDNSQHHHHHHKHHHQHDHSPIQAPKPHSRSQSISKQHKPSLVRPSRFQSLISRLPSSHLLRGKPALRRSQPTRLQFQIVLIGSVLSLSLMVCTQIAWMPPFSIILLKFKIKLKFCGFSIFIN